ncbi:hypothetical protein ABES03_02725 [Neobacillus rhizosphaerae]|uniref:hypothetical protein n=1 Tax=Neobacillus rhizosphaerae TaxID=2880965 RepID=UPI003D2C4983
MLFLIPIPTTLVAAAATAVITAGLPQAATIGTIVAGSTTTAGNVGTLYAAKELIVD